jgi:hypothetical protein
LRSHRNPHEKCWSQSRGVYQSLFVRLTYT